MTKHFFCEENDELYHLTPAQFNTLLSHYFLARALLECEIIPREVILEAQDKYVQEYAKEVGAEDPVSYTWQDMLNHESFCFEYH